MDKESFLSDMINRFGSKKNETKKKEYLEELHVFANMCPEQNLHAVYNYAVSADGYPTLKKLFRFAREHNFIPETDKYSEDIIVYYKCNGFYKSVADGGGKYSKKKFECNTSYSINSGGCPNCGSTSGTIVKCFKSIPEEVIFLKNDCFRCKLYLPENGSKILYLYGPECGVHGSRHSPKTDQVCKSCRCKPCCIDTREFKYQTNHYMEKVRDPKHEIMQPWLKNSRKPGDHIAILEKLEMSKKYNNGG